MSLLPRRRPSPFGLATLPIRPLGMGAKTAADTYDAVAPQAAAVGDLIANASEEGLRAAADAASPVVQTGISTLGNAADTAASYIPVVGPAIGAAINQGADALAAVAPAAMRQAAVPVAKLGGRVAGSVASQTLRGASKLAGVKDEMGGATRSALQARSLAQTTPWDGYGGGPPPEPNWNPMPKIEDVAPEASSQGVPWSNDAAQGIQTAFENAQNYAMGRMGGGPKSEPPPAPIKPEFKPPAVEEKAAAGDVTPNDAIRDRLNPRPRYRRFDFSKDF